ncbi:MAG: glycosyltransferase, partial [Thermodesulfobacteriota bacterium]|nr:glycosyltransferase [Thermodesulfobacteriota bacterium]
MKILQVIPRFNPALGGGVNVVYNISKFMARRGHDVTIITTNYKFDIGYSKIIGKEGVEVIPFDYLFNLHLFIPSPTMKNWLFKNIKKYDIIHLNGARAYQNNIIYKYAIKYDVPYVLQTHGSILRIIEIQRLKRLYDIIWGYKL